MPRLTKRPRVPPAIQAKLCLYIRNGNHIHVAAALAGIHRDTFYDWSTRAGKKEAGYVAFGAAIDQALARAEEQALGQVRRAGKTNWQAAMTFLERRFPERWARTERHEHSGPDGKPIQLDMTKMSDAELAELAKTGRPSGGGQEP